MISRRTPRICSSLIIIIIIIINDITQESCIIINAIMQDTKDLFLPVPTSDLGKDLFSTSVAELRRKVRNTKYKIQVRAQKYKIQNTNANTNLAGPSLCLPMLKQPAAMYQFHFCHPAMSLNVN